MKTLLSLLLCSLLPALAGSFYGGQQAALAATSSAFSPADISGLAVWLVADDVSGADGDAVTDWPAHGSTSITANQTTVAAKPTKQTGEINGHAAILSDAVNDLMPLSASVSTSGSWTVFTVQKRLTSGGLAGSVGNSAAAPAPPFPALEYGSLSRLYVASRTDQKYSSVPSHAYHQITSQDNGGTLVLRVDGAAQSLTAAAATGAYDFTRLFARAGEYWGTYLAEVIIYTRALDSTEIGQVEAYLDGLYFP